MHTMNLSAYLFPPCMSPFTLVRKVSYQDQETSKHEKDKLGKQDNQGMKYHHENVEGHDNQNEFGDQTQT